MKNILLLFVFLSVLTFSSCKKDKIAIIPQIADIEFKIQDLRGPEDALITEVSVPNTLILKRDFTWTTDLGDAISHGTYTWTPAANPKNEITANQQGEIKFTISQWTDFTTNKILSDKLKSVLQTVNNCGFSLVNGSYLSFADNSSNSLLRSYKK